MTKKTKIIKNDIIAEMSERKNPTKNRYLINVVLQTKYYCFNIQQFERGVYIKQEDIEEAEKEAKKRQYRTLLIDKETHEFLRVNLKEFLEREFYPVVFNYPDIHEIKKFFRSITYYGNVPADFKRFEIETLQRLEKENRPDLSEAYEVVE